MNCARMEECAPSRSEIVSNAKVLWTILALASGAKRDAPAPFLPRAVLQAA